MRHGDPDADFDPEHPTEFMLHQAMTGEVLSLLVENAGDHPIYWLLVTLYRTLPENVFDRD